jgi:TonB-dependent starch-binding outer membrane protein SusC
MTIQRLLTRTVSFTLLCVLFTQTAFSQNKTITGKVTDNTGAPLNGVTVSVRGGKTGTSTAPDGTFTLSVPPRTTLTFSGVGYTSQDVTVGDQTNVSVSLIISNSSLNEVVVVGYGTARRKDFTGSVQSIQAKDFNQGVINSPDQLLQNKVAGLEIVNNSGAPGSGTTIQIRGNNSIRSDNNPLYVVDGVALDGRTAKPELDLGKNGLPFGATPESNPLLYINPNDIQQIDVLKDASATAIYGSRGANGIIMITTKKATSSGTKLEAGANWGFAAGFMKNYGLMNASEFRAQSQKYNYNWDSGNSVNALKEITQSAYTQNYNVALSGGNETGKFRASMLLSTADGFVKKTGLDKYLGNFGGSYKFLDKRLSVDFDLIAGHTTENIGLFTNTAGAGGNMLAYALNWNPTVRLKNPDGTWNNNTSNTFGDPNPAAVIDAYNDNAAVNVFLGNVSVGLNIAKGLDYKFLYAINHGAGTRSSSFDGWLNGIQGVSGSGFAALGNGSLTSQTYTHTLNYHTELTDQLKLDAVGGYEYFVTQFATSTLMASQFNINQSQTSRTAIPLYNFMDNASTTFPINQTIDPQSKLQSYFGRASLNWADKYYLTATVRDDGSNRFGINNKYGVFPSFGGRWVISNENFLKNANVLNQLALRGSWGITGNQEFPAGASQAQYSSGSYNAAGQTNVFNPNLKWEKTTATDIGIDFGFLGNRIFGGFDWYRKNTTDILFQSTAIQPAPASIFFINLPANLINTGVEFYVGAGIIKSKDFSWDLNLNISYNSNKLTNFKQALIPTGEVDGNGVSGALAQAITNNQTVDVYYLKPFQGFDKNGAQIVDSAGKGPVFQGNPNPHEIYGISTTLTYKKFSLTVNGGGSLGYKIYNNTLNTITNIYPFSKGQNVAKSNFGTGEAPTDGSIASARYLENGNYFKLRNARLNYSFGTLWYLKNVNAYIVGTNLFEITKFKGFDAEVNIDKSSNSYPSRSMEYLPYPTPRMITLGLNFSL